MLERIHVCPDPVAYRWLLDFLFGDTENLPPPTDADPDPTPVRTPPAAAPAVPALPPHAHSIAARRRRAALVQQKQPERVVTQAADGKEVATA
jgi:hypothetical protein